MYVYMCLVTINALGDGKICTVYFSVEIGITWHTKDDN